jgi:hypothetical protein
MLAPRLEELASVVTKTSKMCAMVILGRFVALMPVNCGHPRTTDNKKADVDKHLRVFVHVGLLANEPPGTAGLLFI